MHVSPAARVADSLLSTGFPADIAAQERNLKWWRTLSPKAQAFAAPARRR